jgi:hypothetical protein
VTYNTPGFHLPPKLLQVAFSLLGVFCVAFIFAVACNPSGSAYSDEGKSTTPTTIHEHSYFTGAKTASMYCNGTIGVYVGEQQLTVVDEDPNCKR